MKYFGFKYKMKKPNSILGELAHARCIEFRRLIGISIVLVSLLTILLSGTYLFADEGRIPIYRATTITVSGHYYLARNFVITSGNGITIQASYVTLDLNGHSITSTSTSGALISISSGYSNIRIHNGTLTGGNYGIYSYSTGTKSSLYIHDVIIRNPNTYGIYLVGLETLEITSCRVYSSGSTGIYASAYSGSFGGKIINNIIENVQDDGINLYLINAGQIIGNQVRTFGARLAGCDGILIQANNTAPTGGNLIEGNTVSLGSSDDHGITITNYSLRNKIINNVVHENGGNGIYIYSSGNLISGNVSGLNGGDGINVLSSAYRNIIESNQCEANTGYGLYFGGATSNAYRNNMLRGNTAGSVGGSANTDAGGNII